MRNERGQGDAAKKDRIIAVVKATASARRSDNLLLSEALITAAAALRRP
jgi:hypothetical protein